MADAGLRDRLVRELGLAVSGVRMSPDCLKAYVQWESCTGQAHALQRELNQRRVQGGGRISTASVRGHRAALSAAAHSHRAALGCCAPPRSLALARALEAPPPAPACPICRVGQLRSKLGRALGARKTPWLEFRQAAPTGEQAHLERIFEQLDRERREQDEEARWARERGQVAQEGDASAAAGGQGQQRPPPAGQ
eukprot:scaffold2.g7504.t1